MNSKYDITKLLKSKPMNAEECAKVIIANLHEEKETGR
jgi:copper chaperone CopZ